MFKRCSAKSEWSFDLGVGEVIDLPIYVTVELQRRDRLNIQLPYKNCFCRQPFELAQGNIGAEIHSDAGINLNYAEDKYNQGTSPVVSCIQKLTKDDILQPFISKKNL